MNKNKIKEEIYRLMDSFLVEAKDQNGNERSLERLNQDRHLFVDNLSAQYEKLIEEVIPKRDKPKLGSENQEIYVAYANGFNDCLSLIRTSLQERGVKIK